MSGERASDRVPDSSRKLQLLAGSDLFGGLPDREMGRLAKASVVLRVPKGRTLLQPGRLAAALYVVADGAITLYRSGAEERSVILGVMSRGDTFDEASIISGGEVEVLAEATEASVVCNIPRSTVHQLLVEYPAFRARMIERIAQRLVDAEQRMVEVAYAPVPVRVALTLLRFSNQGTKPVRLRHADVARIAGTHRETVTKVVNDWGGAGMLSLGRGRITVLDPEALASIAEGNT